MSLKKIYKTRFNDIEERSSIWKILVADFFQQFIDKDDTVLDLACGYGEFINNINSGKKYAIDLNPDCKKYLDKNIIFYKQSSTNISSVKSNSIDKIFVSNFFEHLTRQDIAATVKECYRILRKDGEILILQPNIRFLAADFWRFFDHITAIDDRALEELFLSEKFILKKNILKFLPFTTKTNLPKSAIFIKLYLSIPILWNIFGKQSFLIFKRL